MTSSAQESIASYPGPASCPGQSLRWNQRWMLQAMKRAAVGAIRGTNWSAASWYECGPLPPIDLATLTPALVDEIAQWTNRMPWKETEIHWPEFHRQHEQLVRELLAHWQPADRESTATSSVGQSDADRPGPTREWPVIGSSSLRCIAGLSDRLPVAALDLPSTTQAHHWCGQTVGPASTSASQVDFSRTCDQPSVRRDVIQARPVTSASPFPRTACRLMSTHPAHWSSVPPGLGAQTTGMNFLPPSKFQPFSSTKQLGEL